MKSAYIDVPSRAMINTSPTDESDTYEVNRVSVPARNMRGKGIASILMKELLAEADKEGVTLTLWIHPSGGLTYEQLESWYMRCGFVEQEIGNYLRVPER